RALAGHGATGQRNRSAAGKCARGGGVDGAASGRGRQRTGSSPPRSTSSPGSAGGAGQGNHRSEDPTSSEHGTSDCAEPGTQRPEQGQGRSYAAVAGAGQSGARKGGDGQGDRSASRYLGGTAPGCRGPDQTIPISGDGRRSP